MHPLLAIVVLVSTQMLMLIHTKKVTEQAKLPLVVCSAQFLLSAFLSALMLCVRGPRNFVLKNNMMLSQVIPLSACWTLGFILFNASTVYMSPSLVNLVRCGEPLATVLIGWWAWNQQYSATVLSTLIPICGGVILASVTVSGSSPNQTTVSPQGIVLACLSNICFCVRPFFMKQLQNKLQLQGNNNTTKDEDDVDTKIFFNVTLLASLVLPCLVVTTTRELHDDVFWKEKESTPLLRELFKNILWSSFFFFWYQWTQLKVMSVLSPLAFSILTPVIKAVMIGLCSWYFGDPFTIWSAIGVASTTGGGYLFSKFQKTSNAAAAATATTILPTMTTTTTTTKRRRYQNMKSHDL
jgi:solute carrier family 35 protein E1